MWPNFTQTQKTKVLVISIYKHLWYFMSSTGGNMV